MTRVLGRYEVADTTTCRGKPSFAGTRILVAGVLEQVASGMDGVAIINVWHGDVSNEGIAEAVRLARLARLAQEPATVAG